MCDARGHFVWMDRLDRAKERIKQLEKINLLLWSFIAIRLGVDLWKSIPK